MGRDNEHPEANAKDAGLKESKLLKESFLEENSSELQSDNSEGDQEDKSKQVNSTSPNSMKKSSWSLGSDANKKKENANLQTKEVGFGIASRFKDELSPDQVSPGFFNENPFSSNEVEASIEATKVRCATIILDPSISDTFNEMRAEFLLNGLLSVGRFGVPRSIDEAKNGLEYAKVLSELENNFKDITKFSTSVAGLAVSFINDLSHSNEIGKKNAEISRQRCENNALKELIRKEHGN